MGAKKDPSKAKNKKQAAEPNTASLSSFPLPAMLDMVNLDPEAMNSAIAKHNSGEVIGEAEFRHLMFGMVSNILSSVRKWESSLEEVKADISEISERIAALEAKVGNKDECAVPLSISIQNLKHYDQGDTEAVKSVIRRINAEGVNSEEAVIKVTRKGSKSANGNQSERLGTVLVELQSSEVKTKIMKAKKVLATDDLVDMKNLRISHMKTPAQLSQDYFNRQLLKLVPGGERMYISGTGAILPKAGPPPHAHQGVRGPSQVPPSQLPGQYQVRKPPGHHHQFPVQSVPTTVINTPAADFSQPPPSTSVLPPINF